MTDPKTIIARAMCEITSSDNDMPVCDERCEVCLREGESAIAALHAAGYVIVPREPTEAMLEAAFDDPDADYCDRCMHSGHERNSGWPGIAWELMLEAAMTEKGAGE